MPRSWSTLIMPVRDSNQPTDQHSSWYLIDQWWMFPLLFLVWVFPYAFTAPRSQYLLVELALITAILGFNRTKVVQFFLWCSWPLTFLLLCIFVFLHNPFLLPGTVFFWVSICALGYVGCSIFQRVSNLIRFDNLFLSIPCCIGFGIILYVFIVSLAGIWLKASLLFVLVPLLSLGGGLILFFWKTKFKFDFKFSKFPHVGVAASLIIILPLLLIVNKAIMLYGFDRQNHVESYVPLIWEMSAQDNFPVVCPDSQTSAETSIPPSGGIEFQPGYMCNILNYHGGGKADLWPGHFSGELLLANWVYLSGIHPYQSYRGGQLITSFTLYGFAVLLFSVLLGRLSPAVLMGTILFPWLSGFDFIDYEIQILGHFLLIFSTISLFANKGNFRGAIFSGFLLLLSFWTLYTSYPGDAFVYVGAFSIWALISLGRHVVKRTFSKLGQDVSRTLLICGVLLSFLILAYHHGFIGRFLHADGIDSWFKLKGFDSGPKQHSLMDVIGNLYALISYLVVATVSELKDYMCSDHRWYLIQIHYFHRTPSYWFLLPLSAASALLATRDKLEGVKWPFWLGLLMTLTYIVFQILNLLPPKGMVLLGIAGLLVVPAYFVAQACIAWFMESEHRHFWEIAFLSIVISFLIALVGQAEHPSAAYFAAYFVWPFNWLTAFTIAFASAKLDSRYASRWSIQKVLGLGLWLGFYVYCWSAIQHYAAIFPFRDQGIGMFYRY